MSKRRTRGTFFALFFFAAVTVFPGVVQVLTSKQASHRVATSDFRDTGVLIADGSDPVPRPPSPVPSFWQAA